MVSLAAGAAHRAPRPRPHRSRFPGKDSSSRSRPVIDHGAVLVEDGVSAIDPRLREAGILHGMVHRIPGASEGPRPTHLAVALRSHVLDPVGVLMPGVLLDLAPAGVLGPTVLGPHGEDRK